jgi:hypothetical protein
VIAPYTNLRGTPLVDLLASASPIDPAEPDDTTLFAMLSASSRRAMSHADAMRRAMDHDSVHITHLLAALQHDMTSSAAAALRAAAIDEAKLRELIAGITGAPLPDTVHAVAITALPPLSERARPAVIAAFRLSRDGIIHMRDLFAGAMSMTDSALIAALIDRGVRVPPPPEAAPEAQAAPAALANADDGSRAPAQTAATSAIAAALAGFRSDGVSDQDDLLDIERDVSALCSVIAARDVEPPLSIGLFGDWGSGKSFFLEAMRAQLARIEKAADQAEQAAIAGNRPIKQATRYCARITQIEFNAWRYIDTDLWASLADGIIDGLARALERPTLDKVSATERARLLAAAAHSRDVIADAEAGKRVAEANLHEQEQAFRRALARAQAPRRGAAAVKQEARVLVIASSPDLQKELAKVTTQLRTSATTTEAKAALLDLQGLWGTTRALWRALHSSSLAALIGIAVLGALIAGEVRFHDDIKGAIRFVVGAAVAIMTWFASFRPYLQRARTAVGEIKRIVDKHGAALEAAQAEAAEQDRLKRDHLSAAAESAQRRLSEARHELEQIEIQLLALRADQQMAKFLRERQASDDYRKHLGVIARARSDFERLSDLLVRTRDDAPEQGLPRIDRIVLYIDDLDRCDEEQVVKVLQAVHLLLAFKLFVVVVAVDSRWLLHSLQQHSKAFQSDAGADQGISEDERLHWQSTPLNYLEKIFQIPFTLKPMGTTGFDNMIEHLTAQLAETEIATPIQGAASSASKEVRPAPSPAADAPDAAAPTATAPAFARAPDPAAPALVPTAHTQEAAVPQAKPAAPAAPRPTLAETPVDVVPPHLVIEPWEQSFMKQFHELIATPRAVKRFVNVYRLLKARVPDDRAAAFRGDVGGGEHRAAIFLLALLIGFPSEATDLMRDLTEQPALEDWWLWLTMFVSAEKQTAAARSAHQERLFDLTTKLSVIRKRFDDRDFRLPATEVFRFWTPYVARFSFQAGRLTTTVRVPPPPPAAPEAESPAAPRPRTAAGTVEPRDRPDVS